MRTLQSINPCVCSLILDIEKTHETINCCGNVIQGPLKNVVLSMRISSVSWRFNVNHSSTMLLKFHPLPSTLWKHYYFIKFSYFSASFSAFCHSFVISLQMNLSVYFNASFVCNRAQTVRLGGLISLHSSCLQFIHEHRLACCKHTSNLHHPECMFSHRWVNCKEKEKKKTARLVLPHTY